MSSTEKIREHRIASFERLGFPVDEALLLAEAVGLDGFKLSHHDVKKYLAAGATTDQIVEIFGP